MVCYEGYAYGSDPFLCVCVYDSLGCYSALAYMNFFYMSNSFGFLYFKIVIFYPFMMVFCGFVHTIMFEVRSVPGDS